MFGQATFPVWLLAVRNTSQSAWRCWAYLPDGSICRRPHRSRGCRMRVYRLPPNMHASRTTAPGQDEKSDRTHPDSSNETLALHPSSSAEGKGRVSLSGMWDDGPISSDFPCPGGESCARWAS